MVVGAVLAAKVLTAMGVRESDSVSLEEGAFGLALLMGPACLLGTVAKYLRNDIVAGKCTTATYWTTMVGLSVTALALVGVTSVDDLIVLASRFHEWLRPVLDKWRE
ncbi:hypothetical protein ACZ90_10095 [Streptomyces albus subsp. albus]|nr:hypothetical protein ACZ90_10095 [Streptomyces albus subsp. albus]